MFRRATRTVVGAAVSSALCSRVPQSAMFASPVALPVVAAPLTAMRHCSSAKDPQPAADFSALEIAKQVNAMKRSHQSAAASERKRIEAVAWKALNQLTEDQITAAEGQAVALLLNAWAYFAKFWERGKEGPAEPTAAQ
jgi:hypothetical protein